MRRYTISRNHAPIRGGEPYYLVAELDWDDMDALRRAFQSPVGQATAQDVPESPTVGFRSMVYELEDVVLQRHFVILRKSLWRYGFANVIAMRTVVAGPDCFAATTAQAPARWAGSRGNSSKQISSELLSLQTVGWWDELRMLGRTAPYQVCMLTATSMEAGAVRLTSNPYRAGSGAVITYWAEERPLDIARFAACGFPMTLVVPACSRSCLLLLPVQATLAIASKLHIAKEARLRLTAIA